MIYKINQKEKTMKQLTLRLLMCAIILTFMVTACAPSTRTSPPKIDDIYWPYSDIDTSFSVSCGENDDLFSYDTSAPLDIQTGESGHASGMTVTDLTYTSPKGGRVPATLVIPDGDGPFAGLLLQHGMGAGSHPGARNNYLPEAEAYARLGAVVLLIDAPYNRPEHGYQASMNLTEQDRREQIQYIIDLRRGVDLLLSKPEVDPQRLAYIGISGGGAIGGLLAGVEHRLQGYVLVIGDGGLVTHITGPEDYGWWSYKPEGLRQEWISLMWPIESIHYIGCAAPAALLFQNGTLDNSVPPADALRYQRAGSEPKTVMWYEATHNDLGTEAFLDRARWLGDTIGIARYRGYPKNVENALIAWVILTIISLAVLAWDMWHKQLTPPGARLLWLLTTMIIGPLGLAIYWISSRTPNNASLKSVSTTPRRGALASAAWAASGNLFGVMIAFVVLISSNLSPFLTIAVIIVLPFCIGWLIFALVRLLSRSDPRFQADYHRPWLAEMTSTCLVLLGGFLTFIYLFSNVFTSWVGPGSINLTYPPLWGAFCLAAVVGMCVTFPFHLWMIKRGVIRWGEASISGEEIASGIPWAQQAVILVIAFAAISAIMLLTMRGN
jgi:uncharacterized protein